MSKTSIVTARVDSDTLADLDRLAQHRERSRAWLVNKAISKFVKEETEFLAFLKEGEDAIDRGEFYTQEEVEAWFEQRKRQRTAA